MLNSISKSCFDQTRMTPFLGKGFWSWPLLIVLAVASVFFTAAFHHVVNPAQAEVALGAVGVSPAAARVLVFTLGPVELHLGLLLLVGKWRRVGMKLSGLTLFVFSAFLWKLSALPEPPACGCLGLGPVLRDSRHELLLGLLRNVVLLFALSYALHRTGSHGRPDGQPLAANPLNQT
ncbi:MAG: MauE/DoxX family redox-associated membrane protein [Limisphaerales bacterium]